jgi:hypothetical protein
MIPSYSFSRTSSSGLLRATTGGSITSHHRLVKAAIDLYNAGGDRGRPRLEFHIADHRWTSFYLRIDFPVPPRGRLLLNAKINAMVLHERLSAPPLRRPFT